MPYDLLHFLKAFNISEKDFAVTHLEWEDLQAIRNDYKGIMKELNLIARYIEDKLQELPSVHSVRSRIKDPNHLIAKIIRKRISFPERKITIDNYRTLVTDLIGIRAIHLFKEDWVHIHNFIKDTWDLHEKPIAYIRQGDSGSHIDEYIQHDFTIEPHPYGYRSIHYSIESKPSKDLTIAEIQVRTIFEEGWSEIDHTIKYPKNIADPLLNTFLDNFNILAGNSDQMGSFVRHLKEDLLRGTQKLEMYEKLTEKHTVIIDTLKKRVAGTLGELTSKVSSIEKKMSVLDSAEINSKPFEYVLQGILEKITQFEKELARDPQKANALFEISAQELVRLDTLVSIILNNIEHLEDHRNRKFLVTAYKESAIRFSENIRALSKLDSVINNEMQKLFPTQPVSQSKVESAVKTINTTSKFVKFFIGPKFYEIHILRKELERNKSKLQTLTILSKSIVDPAMHFVLWTQINLFTEQNEYLEQFIKKAESGVSLLGRLFKMFEKR